MKRIFNIGALLLAVAGASVMSSCSDEFIEDKKNFTNTSTEIYDYYSGADGRVNEIYRISLPNIQAGGGQIWQYNSVGKKDNHSQATEEYYGFSTFLDPTADMNTVTGKSQNPGYFGSSWARMREINEVIRGISNGSLSQDEKDELLGQVYFLRAWCYYMMFRYYGSVPLVTEVQNPVPESVTPRSSAKEVYNFIVSELDNAANLLKKRTVENKWTSDNWGRVTTGTCLALKHRVMILWASPLFNRDNEASRWQAAYDAIKAELPTIDACGYGLAYENAPGVNGKGWANMFLDIVDNPEGVFVSCYNTKTPDLTPDYQRNNLWEQQARPANTLGNNGQTPTDAIIDLFPMKDGKRPASYQNYTVLSASDIAYDPKYPFIDRDPRFYRTFSFPGEYWRFDGDPNTSSSFNPYKGDKYILWNYVWFNDPANYDDPTSSDYYGADNLLTNVHGMYIRKFSDDLDIRNGVKNYNFNTAGKNVGFRECKTMTMEIRYAEVLLNYAEAACGVGEYNVAVEQLKRIRMRAGIEAGADGLYGIDAAAQSSAAACMAAILYERQIEFAYEGKRFEDMRRWLLFDGGKDFASIGAKALTGWGGNTCTWLGFKPYGLNDNVRSDQIVFRLRDDLNYTDGKSGRTWTGDVTADQATKDLTNPDPILKTGMGGLTRADRDAFAVDINEKVVNTPLATQLENLKTFYSTYLVRKTQKGDSYDSATGTQPIYNKWNARYYFWGLTQGEQINNPTLPQTVGWEDYYNGGTNGTYDPLAE